MTNPKKNGDLMLRVRYDSGAELAGPAVITDEGALLVSLGGAASMLVQRADGRFAVRYGKYLKDNRTALDAAIIDPTGLVARHVATIKPKWD